MDIKTLTEEQIKLEMLRLELAEKQKPPKKKWSITAVGATIIVALMSFIGSMAGSFLQSKYASDLERQKFEANLIINGLKDGTQDQKAQYLNFLKNINLVSDDSLVAGISKYTYAYDTAKAINGKVKTIDSIPNTKSAIDEVATPSTTPKIKPRVYLHIADEAQRNTVAADLQDALTIQNFIVPGIQNVVKLNPNVKIPNAIEVRYSFITDEAVAIQLISLLTSLGCNPNTKPVFSPANAGDRPNHFEIWFAKNTILKK
jgi:hypothetical protein